MSSADPNPANWRIVHSRVRYPSGYSPRVYGNSPGAEISRSTFSSDSGSPGPPAASGPYTGLRTTPEIVTA